ncbi:MAG: HEAT repeat domain-containing protein, partial [Bacteroidota bacterium]
QLRSQTTQRTPSEEERLFIQVQRKLLAATTNGLPGAVVISPAEREAIRTKLAFYYSKTGFPYVKSLFDEHHSKHVQDLECQLLLFAQRLIKEDKGEASGREDHVAKHHERLEWFKTPLAPADLFKKRSIKPGEPVKEIHKLLLTGDPGTGKTTLSKQLAYQWSAGEWGQEFDAVYLLPVRNLQQSQYDGRDYDRKKTLSTAIVNNCFEAPGNEAAYKRLRDHIEAELQKPTTLVILDGLDERAGASAEILRQAQAGTHKLLMLSRPYGIDTERRLANIIEVEHAGFNDEQLRAYVQQEVSDAALSAALLGYLEQHENIRAIAHIPVNLQILCTLWQDPHAGVQQELGQGSLPGLYVKLTEWVWRRYKKRQQEGVSAGDREALFDKLGKIALSALEAGEILISPGLIDKSLTDRATDADEVKNKCQDAGFLLLQSIDQKFYQFLHLTFQEYFAGRALASQLLSGERKDARSISKFLSEHKYDPRYGRTLSFMSGELSIREEGVEGIARFLRLLGESDKEIVGVQHLLLQLRVLHEWLCLSDEDVGESLAALSEEFKLYSCLAHWFGKAFGHIRREGYATGSTGDKLLKLLVSSLETFGSVTVHAPDLLKPLKEAAQDYNVHVRRSSLKSLGQLVSTIPSHVPAMRDILLRAAQDRDADYVRPVGLEALGQVVAAAPGEVAVILDKLVQAAQGGDAYARPGALAALGQVVSASPGHVSEVPEPLLKAVQDEDMDVRQAGVSALGQVAGASPDKAPALLETLREAAADKAWPVRQAAVTALGQVVGASSGESGAILESLYQAVQDEIVIYVRQAAATALGQAVWAAPGEARAILERLSKALEEEGYVAPYVAALTAFGEIAKAAPSHASAVLERLEQAAKHSHDDIRQAAISALGQVAEAAPGKSLAILASLRQATQDEDADVRQAALHKISLQELLKQYFADPSTNSILIPHLTARLCHTPLVLGKSSSGEDHRQVILYATAGDPAREDHPSGVVEDFVGRIVSSASQSDQRFPFQMGKPDWERYFGDVGAVPPLPDGIAEILDSDCPFWPGNKVADTHMLVLIPEQVAAKPLTLDYLRELIQSPQGGGHKTQYRGDWYAKHVRPAIGNQVSGSLYWVLMTRDVLPGSRWKSYGEQCELVADHANRTGLSYELPGALEAAVVVLLHHVRSGEHLYSDNPFTYTRSRDKNKDGDPVVVGGFSSAGLAVGRSHYDLGSGVSALRKF